jgi:hypothetical protein
MTDSQSSKVRLYLALYIRDGVTVRSQALDHYHWALLAISSKDKSLQPIATRFHARDYYINPSQTHWIYEEIHVSSRGTPKLLSQTYIGDVVETERLFEILRDAPVKQEMGWNCVSWVRGAMEMVWADEVLEGGKRDAWEGLEWKALIEADAEVVRRERRVRAVL